MGVLILWLLCVCGFYFIFSTPNTCIKLNNYLLLFSFYFWRSLDLIFYIVISVVVVGFQTWTGSWFSLNNIVGLYILNIFPSWQLSSVLYLKFGARFQFWHATLCLLICLPPSTNPHHHPIVHHITHHPLPRWKSEYYFILYQYKLLFVIVFIIFFGIGWHFL